MVKLVDPTRYMKEVNMNIETYRITLGMGKSNEWTKLGLSKDEIEQINEIGYLESDYIGKMEIYLNKIHVEDYLYRIEHLASNCMEYWDEILVIRV